MPAISIRLKWGCARQIDEAADSAVADEQVRAAPEQEEGQAVLAANQQQPGQFLLGGWFGVKIRVAADAQGGASGEAFVRAQNRGRRKRGLEFAEDFDFLRRRHFLVSTGHVGMSCKAGLVHGTAD